MRHSMLSFSKAELVELCPWMASDAAPAKPSSELSSDEARLGRAFHAVVARIINKGLGTGPAHLIDDALKANGLDVNRYQRRLADMRPIEHALYSMKIAGITLRAEVSLGLNLSDGSAKEIGVDIGRGYPADPGWIYGTADLLHQEYDALDGTLVLVIGDWKVGPMARQETTQADRNKQLGLLAQAAMTIYGPDHVRVERKCIGPDGDLLVDSYVYDAVKIAEMDVWLQELEASIERASTSGPTPGAHCSGKYCPLLSVCPKVQAMTQEIISVPKTMELERALTPKTSALPLNVTSVDQIQNADHAGVLWAFARAVKTLAEQKIDLVKNYTDKFGAVPVGPGKIYGPREKKIRSIRATTVEELRAVLARDLPAEDLEKLVYATSPISELEARIKLRCDVGAGSAKVRGCMTELRNAGFIEETKVIEHRAHKPPKIKDGGKANADDEGDEE